MILLPTDTLRIVLGSAPTTQGSLVAGYADSADDFSTLAADRVSSITTGTTPVDWVAAPASGEKRQIKFLSLCNEDASSITATINLHDGTNLRRVIRVTLAAGEQMHYHDTTGFRILASDGSLKSAALVVDGDKGEISISGGVWTLDSAVVTLAKMAVLAKTQPFVVPVSDETTALTAGVNKVKFRMPCAWTLTGVRASLSTAQTSGSILTVDINEGGTTILSTKLTIDNTESTSTTAATPAVISDASLADDAEISIDLDQVGDGTAKGLKVTFLGYPT